MSESQTHVVATSPSSSGQPEDKLQDPSQCPRRRLPGWEGNERNTLLVVATLITALTYQLGTNYIPDGCWQDDKMGAYTAGDPIMRDEHQKRYWLFMTASWMGFGSSMLMIVYLLTGVPVNSGRVRWPFVVACSSLMVMTFITSRPRTRLTMDLALWVCLVLFLWAAISFKNLEERFCWRASFDRIKNSFKGYW